jgi:hypothetical protein
MDTVHELVSERIPKAREIRAFRGELRRDTYDKVVRVLVGAQNTREPQRLRSSSRRQFCSVS